MPSATPEGTSRYMTKQIDAKMPAGAFSTFGRTGLKASRLGFGTYRVTTKHSAHSEALLKAISSGTNVIDTSTNYGDGDAERCIGNVLHELFEKKVVNRDEIIVISKVGYVQGSNLELMKRREQKGSPYADVVKYMDNCWHCIHPDFINDQLENSLARLQIEKLDVFLLHNPEYYLMDAVNHHPDMRIDQIRDIFYDRIKRAFRKLEDLVTAKKIGHYGVSSNTFGKGLHEFDHTNVEKMWEIACNIGKDRSNNPYQHHFSIVQMPINLLESEPLLTENNDDGKTAVAFAHEKELCVLANRPLNAIQGNQMIRLADLKVKKVDISPQRQMKIVVMLEEEFVERIGSKIDAKGELKPDKFFVWGHELSKASLKSFGLEQWKQIEFEVIRPQISYLSQAMDLQLKGELTEAWNDWRDRYVPNLIKLLESIREDFSKRSAKQIKGIGNNLDAHLPKTMHKLPLSQKALATVIHTEGVTCVLNGMRTPEYVADSISALSIKSFDVKLDLYRALT